MYLFDASSIIHAWEAYPKTNFPRTWTWIEERIKLDDFCISRTAHDQVEVRARDCHEWLREKNIKVLQETSEVLNVAAQIQRILQIKHDHFHSRGVDEADILIIASAKEMGVPVISEEAKQPNPPAERRRCKIPAVCKLESVNVECLSFLELIQQLNPVF